VDSRAKAITGKQAQHQQGDGESENEKAPIDPRKYKSRLCRNWVQSGECSYEHTCCFAHGESELRDAVANLKILNSLGYFLNGTEENPKLEDSSAHSGSRSSGKGGGPKHPGPARGKPPQHQPHQPTKKPQNSQPQTMQLKFM